MSDFWKFWYDSPFLSFVAIYLTAQLVEIIVFRTPNRIIRHLNIRKHGWPPEHCDADGDFKTKEYGDAECQLCGEYCGEATLQR